MYISVRKYLLQRRSKLLSRGVSSAAGMGGGGGGGGKAGRLNNSLRRLAVWASRKGLKFFILIETWKFNYLSAFAYFHLQH